MQAKEKIRQEAAMRKQAEEKVGHSEEKLVQAAQALLKSGMAPEKVAST
jgi:hypothetical protein